MSLKNLYYIYTISDSIGETNGRIARAAANQFDEREYIIKNYPFVLDVKLAEYVVDEAAEHSSIVIFTTVIAEIRKAIIARCKQYGIKYIDVMEPTLAVFESHLNEKSRNEPGATHRLDANYFRRIDAIEFAVKYDDGKDPRGLKKADVVIIGVSRTSKTPLSMYMANNHYKAANVPIVPGVPLPAELYQVDRKKIVGLVTSPQKLSEIRQERLRAMGLGAQANYASLERIIEELEYADGIMKKLGCPVIDVSNKAIEETASVIIEMIKKKNEEEV
ncbi:MAG: phosphoenolpyruvate synthase regulatory protein [Clostridiales bacterium]|nr:MAG: phosphoenolpyruvate synthase regulatory protein [Clostridiales bacterium]